MIELHFITFNLGIGYGTHLRSQGEAASRLSINLTKQRLILAVALSKVRSKFLTRILQRSIHALDRSITQRATAGTNPDFLCAAFCCFEGLVDN
jgi:hypothetical protein